MKRTALATVGLLFLGMVALPYAAGAADVGEVKWFDMDNCVFCKHLVKDPKLLDNMTWEHHDISNGVVTISTVKPEYRKAYDEAHMGMMAVGKKLQTGEMNYQDVTMCGHCKYYGELMQSGIKTEYVQGKAADVVIMTSDTPEGIKKIKEFAQRNRDEMANMEKAEKAEKAH